MSVIYTDRLFGYLAAKEVYDQMSRILVFPRERISAKTYKIITSTPTTITNANYSICIYLTQFPSYSSLGQT